MKMKTYHSLSLAIRDIYGERRHIVGRRPVSGGDINEAYALTLDDGTTLFMKSNVPGALANFIAEANGLEAIRATGAIGVPKVLAVGRDAAGVASDDRSVSEAEKSFLLLEFLTGGKRIRNFWEVFARELAAMHRSDVGDRYGFWEDNWIGDRKQENTLSDSWITFFRDSRLKPQFEAAGRYFSSSDRMRIDRLMSHLDRYLTEPEKPSLVHGDLWAGNMITGNDGKGWLIDPAVYYGHPEVDIAMTQLFGGFSFQFYEAYREAGALDLGYHDRRDLYNLYHLLNHLNIFGSGYLSSVRQVLKRYA